MAPEGLKIGDTFEEVDGKRTFIQQITAIDDYGRYISKCIGLKGSEVVVPVEDFIQEELPFTIPDDELAEEQPIVEEVKEEKKPAPKKVARKKTTAKKTSKK